MDTSKPSMFGSGKVNTIYKIMNNGEEIARFYTLVSAEYMLEVFGYGEIEEDFEVYIKEK